MSVEEIPLESTTQEALRRPDWGPQVKRVAIADEVISRFRALIAGKVLTPGCQLPPERELVDILGVSRPTLRQALKGLQVLGIIRSRQGAGSYLSDSTSEMLRVPLEFAIAFKGTPHNDLFEARQLIEVKLAALAAERRSNNDLKRIYDALVVMGSFKGNPERYCEHGLRFHACIADASQNTVMMSIIEMLAGLLMEARRQSVRRLVDYDASYRDHEQIALNIEKQDVDGASRAMLEHFRNMKTRADS